MSGITDAGKRLAERFRISQSIDEYRAVMDAAEGTPLSDADVELLSAARQEARQRITRETHSALCKTLIQRFRRAESHEAFFAAKNDLDAWMIALTLYAPPDELDAVKVAARIALDELDGDKHGFVL